MLLCCGGMLFFLFYSIIRLLLCNRPLLCMDNNFVEEEESIFPLVRYKNQFTGIDIVYKLWIIDQLKRFFEQKHHCGSRLLLSAMIGRRSF